MGANKRSTRLVRRRNSFRTRRMAKLDSSRISGNMGSLLITPLEKQVEIYTDSETAIRNIRKGLQSTEKSKIMKMKNAVWIMKIVDLCKIKNLRMALFKVKSHSKDK